MIYSKQSLLGLVALAAVVVAPVCSLQAASYYRFEVGDLPLDQDFVFEVGDTVEIFLDYIPVDPIFTGFVTINGGTLIVNAMDGLDTSPMDEGRIFQAFTPGQFSGDFDDVQIFNRTALPVTIGVLSYNISFYDGPISLFSSTIGGNGDLVYVDGLLYIATWDVDTGTMLLTPYVPEPATYALLLGGLVAGGMVLRRRRQRG